MGELKAEWKRVRFGEVVRQVRDKVDPELSGLERFVAGEHMDTDELRIRRWGDIGGGYLGPAFHMRFRPGHVLYGSRRTYLRKVAVADFEGVCANTTFVLESDDRRVLLQELLPFIMSTEAFHEHSKRESKGSVNPYVNFSDLAWYEFDLPPLEEQTRIVGLLEAANLAARRHSDLAGLAEGVTRSAYIERVLAMAGIGWMSGKLGVEMFPRGWTLRPASEFCSDLITKGATPSGCLETKDTGIPFLKVYNLTFTGALDFSINPTWISAAGHRELRRSAVVPGDVLMNIVGPPLGKVSRVPEKMPESNINQALVRFRPSSSELGVWLEAYLLSPVAQAWLMLRSKKTSGQRNLTLETCRELPVPVPPDLLDRLQVLRTLRESEATIKARSEAGRRQTAMLTARALASPMEIFNTQTRPHSCGGMQ